MEEQKYIKRSSFSPARNSRNLQPNLTVAEDFKLYLREPYRAALRAQTYQTETVCQTPH